MTKIHFYFIIYQCFFFLHLTCVSYLGCAAYSALCIKEYHSREPYLQKFHTDIFCLCTHARKSRILMHFLTDKGIYTTFGILCTLCWSTRLWIGLWYLGYLLVQNCEHLFKLDTFFFSAFSTEELCPVSLCLQWNHRKLGKLETIEI